MKKIFSVLVALMLVLSCTTAAFAATATPDEAKETSKLEMTKLPDKLEYSFEKGEIGWTYNGLSVVDILNQLMDNSEAFEKNKDFSDIVDALNNGNLEEGFEQLAALAEKTEFYANVDMTGAVVTATYTDGTTEVIDNALLTVKVTDPANLKAIIEQYAEFIKKLEGMEDIIDDDDDVSDEFTYELMEEMAAFQALIYREYNVEVSYGGASTSFKINVTPFDDILPMDNFEFVSYDEPEVPTYYLSKDAEHLDKIPMSIIEDYETGEEIIEYADTDMYSIKFDTSNITVTVKDEETGELVEIPGDEVEIEYTYFTDEIPKTGTYYASAMTTGDIFVSFDYKFKLVNDLDSNSTDDKKDNSKQDEKGTNSSGETKTTGNASTSDSATPDAANDISSDTSANGVVQTGSPAVPAVFAVVLASAAAVMYFFSRKRTE